MEGEKCCEAATPGKGGVSSRKLGAAAAASVAARPVGGALLMSLVVVDQCGISITVINSHHAVKQELLCRECSHFMLLLLSKGALKDMSSLLSFVGFSSKYCFSNDRPNRNVPSTMITRNFLFNMPCILNRIAIYKVVYK